MSRRATAIALVVLVALVLVAHGHGKHKTPGETAAAYVTIYGSYARQVEATVAAMQVEISLLQRGGTDAELNQLAVDAQTAHDDLDGLRQQFPGDGGSDEVAIAETNVFDGSNDLKNSMGAIVTYTGAPNPATLASLTTQYRRAVAEWNGGVRVIWRLAGATKAPVV